MWTCMWAFLELCEKSRSGKRAVWGGGYWLVTLDCEWADREQNSLRSSLLSETTGISSWMTSGADKGSSLSAAPDIQSKHTHFSLLLYDNRDKFPQRNILLLRWDLMGFSIMFYLSNVVSDVFFFFLNVRKSNKSGSFKGNGAICS